MYSDVMSLSEEPIKAATRKSIDDEALEKMLMKSGLFKKADCVSPNIAFSGK